MITYSSSPLYPYFVVNGEYKDSEYYYETRLCRYHKYLDITDYCGNTEIWYFSFSLYLSNLIEDKSWKKCDKKTGFKYYKFDDLNIVSPIDLPRNLNRLSQFNINLSIMSETKSELDWSNMFIDKGYSAIDSELQIYEMYKYKTFLDELRNYI